jgi:hypothetical protein
MRHGSRLVMSHKSALRFPRSSQTLCAAILRISATCSIRNYAASRSMDSVSASKGVSGLGGKHCRLTSIASAARRGDTYQLESTFRAPQSAGCACWAAASAPMGTAECSDHQGLARGETTQAGRCGQPSSALQSENRAEYADGESLATYAAVFALWSALGLYPFTIR